MPTASLRWVPLALIALCPVSPAVRDQPIDLPREWIDGDTGHRVIRLSEEPGSQTLYFHQNGYTPDGERLAITTPSGLSVVNLRTRTVEKVVDGRVSLIMVGRKTGEAYYVRAGAGTTSREPSGRCTSTSRRTARSSRGTAAGRRA
jgi:oligogalacturonide lyase